MTTIAEGFGNLGVTITNKQIAQMERLVVYFALRKTHPLTFDGLFLGVDPVYFSPADRAALFDVFGTTERKVDAVIRQIPSIRREFRVTSDPFNLFCIWLCHLAPIYIKDKKICYQFMFNVLMYYHYKLFTSIVNNLFPHGTNEGVMKATVESLTKKSDIITFESWKRLIESHVDKMLVPTSATFKTISDGSPDELFLQVIGKSQTAIRAKLRTFAGAYYETHAKGIRIGSSSSVAENDEGEKIIAQTASVIDSMTADMVAMITNPNVLVNDEYIADVTKTSTNVSPRMLKTALLHITQESVFQMSKRTFDKVETKHGETIFIGLRALTVQIIRSMIRICQTRGINLGNRSLVYKTMHDVYMASRITDADILSVKNSIGKFLDQFEITSNEASKKSLRLSVIYYILYRAILKMHV